MRKSPSDFVSDRGPAKHFHGRKQILRDFGKILRHSTQNNWGTTFLIQGAPGAGKTALLTKCEELARDSKWKTAKIYPAALWDPNELQQSLESKKKFEVEGGSARIGIPGIGQAEVSAGMPPQTVKTLLRKGKDPLLLALDEAQVLGKEGLIPPDQGHTVVSVLNAIHNGELDRPVILIAAGLGTTVEAFGKLGISRFAADALVELGALGKESERAVLHDWLREDGEAKGDLTAWIDMIVQETHGWPQHILSYVKPALDQLHADERVMTAKGLNAVLEAGRVFRSEYYDQRAHDFEEEHRQSFAKLLAEIPLGGSTTGSAIRSHLTQEYGAEEAKKLFRRALYCGILHKHAGRYTVPIPSMHDWLVSKYAREQIKFPHGVPPIRSMEDRSSGIDFGR